MIKRRHEASPQCNLLYAFAPWTWDTGATNLERPSAYAARAPAGRDIALSRATLERRRKRFPSIGTPKICCSI